MLGGVDEATYISRISTFGMITDAHIFSAIRTERMVERIARGLVAYRAGLVDADAYEITAQFTQLVIGLVTGVFVACRAGLVDTAVAYSVTAF